MNHGVQAKSNIAVSSDIQFTELFHIFDLSGKSTLYIGDTGLIARKLMQGS